jgi:hypothetical protein
MLTVMRTELLAVRRDRKGLLDELVDLTESYDSVVRVTEEQVGTLSLVLPYPLIGAELRIRIR